MKILIIGSGGREHAIAYKLKKSPLEPTLFVAPGNAGTGLIATNIDIAADDSEALLAFALGEKIDLTIVGPEAPLAAGIVDLFNANELKIFGPDKDSARLESSKSFTKRFLEKHNLPTARYVETSDYEEALAATAAFDYPIVVKADGLCAGKGVVICEDEETTENTIRDMMQEKIFGEEGTTVVLEEFLDGYEASVFAIVSKGKLFPMVSAKDYKKIYDGDKGPNTGGVGAFAPNVLIDEKDNRVIYDEIIPSIEKAFEEEGFTFDGVLFIGFMIDREGPKILEFNVRFGDPETQVVLQKLDSDLVEILTKAVDGTLKKKDFRYNDRTWMTVIITSAGYPGKYTKMKEIEIRDIINEDLIVLHNGTVEKGGRFYTNGGRVLSLVTDGKDLAECREKIYGVLEGKTVFEGATWRTDIGKLGEEA